MSDFCNQCAKKLGFPEGDFLTDREPLKEGFGYPELCEGCGPCFVDEQGNCIDAHCDCKHGQKEKEKEVKGMVKCDCGGELQLIDDHLCQCKDCNNIYSDIGLRRKEAQAQ